MVVTAVIQLSPSEMNTTWKSDRQYSPVPSSERPIAPNAMIATAVAPRSGIACWPTTSRAASSAFCPSWILTSMPSTTTIALSTSMPNAMISAPREMRSSATFQGPMKIKVPLMVRTRTKPMIMLLRSPMKIRSTPITIATA